MELKNGTTIKKRHFYNGKHYTIDRENNVVRLTPEFATQLRSNKLWGKFGFKKIGGSSLGNVLGSNPFGSRFEESLRIMWLNLPMFDDKYTKAGQEIEPKVVAIMESKLNQTLKRYSGEDYDYDYFKEHEFIGGLPDATGDRRTYELKTTGEKNIQKWEEYGVPEYYQQQVALYDYLLYGNGEQQHTFEAVIVACFLKEEDYANPANVDLTSRVIKSYKVKYDPSDVESWMEKSKKFRDVIIKHGVSFPFDLSNKKDAEIISYLECKDENEYNDWLVKTGKL